MKIKTVFITLCLASANLLTAAAPARSYQDVNDEAVYLRLRNEMWQARDNIENILFREHRRVGVPNPEEQAQIRNNIVCLLLKHEEFKTYMKDTQYYGDFDYVVTRCKGHVSSLDCSETWDKAVSEDFPALKRDIEQKLNNMDQKDKKINLDTDGLPKVDNIQSQHTSPLQKVTSSNTWWIAGGAAVIGCGLWIAHKLGWIGKEKLKQQVKPKI